MAISPIHYEQHEGHEGCENLYEGFFVLFVSFVVKLILGCGRRLRGALCGESGSKRLRMPLHLVLAEIFRIQSFQDLRPFLSIIGFK